MSEDRLQKILARAGLASRREAEEFITAGRVTVNGRVATLGDKADAERDAIKVDGKRLHPPTHHRYLLLNKPRAVMSTVSDPEGRPTVIELVPLGLRKALVPVGRLDFLTEGLLLLTDDGDFAHRVAHPRYGCTKTYEVKVRGMPRDRDLDRLRQGISIDGVTTAPAVIEPRPMPGEGENSWWNVQLSQGRTRQIREMFERVGHPVMKLRRVAIGPVQAPDLPLGALRELTEREVELLLKSGRRGTLGRRGGGAGAGGRRPSGRGRKAGAGRSPARRGRGEGPPGGQWPEGQGGDGGERREGGGTGPAPRRKPGGRAAPGRRQGGSGGRRSGGPAPGPGGRRGPHGGGGPAGGPGPGDGRPTQGGGKAVGGGRGAGGGRPARGGGRGPGAGGGGPTRGGGKGPGGGRGPGSGKPTRGGGKGSGGARGRRGGGGGRRGR